METENIKNLLTTLSRLEKRNNALEDYYDGKRVVPDLGTIIPASFRGLREGLGWCQIAIDALSERISISDISISGEGTDELAEWVNNIIEDNEVISSFDGAVKDFLLLGVAFIKVSINDEDPDLPQHVITVEDPNRIYGNINKTTKKFIDCVRVVDDETVEYYTRDNITVFNVKDGNWKVSHSYDHGLGEVPIIPIINRPTSKGWGQSDLSNNARLIFDRAQRMILRLELASERYSIPQRYILGLSPDDLKRKSGGSSGLLDDPYIVLGDAEDDPDSASQNVRADIGTLQTSNPESFIKPLNNDRAEFAIACSIPDSYMGIEKSNPSSADAIRMGESRLIKKAEKRITTLKQGMAKVMRLLVKQYDGETPENWTPEIVFSAPHTHTEAATADAVVKLVQSSVLPADHEITLRKLGLTPQEVVSIQNHGSTREASTLRALIEGVEGYNANDEAEEVSDEG